MALYIHSLSLFLFFSYRRNSIYIWKLLRGRHFSPGRRFLLPFHSSLRICNGAKFISQLALKHGIIKKSSKDIKIEIDRYSTLNVEWSRGASFTLALLNKHQMCLNRLACKQLPRLNALHHYHLFIWRMRKFYVFMRKFVKCSSVMNLIGKMFSFHLMSESLFDFTE